MSILQPQEPQDVQDFQFKLLCRLRVFLGHDDLYPTTAVNYVATASTQGLIFVGCPTGFQVIRSSSILSLDHSGGEVSDYPRRYVQLPSKPSHIVVNCDQSLLIVALKTTDDCAHAYIYNVASFLSKDLKLVTEIHLSTDPLAQVLDLVWNPGMCFMVACSLSNGAVMVYEIKKTGIGISTLPPATQATCLCWSPKGKRLVIGTQTGTLAQYKPELTVVKVIEAPTSLGTNIVVVNVVWISNFQYGAWYRDMADDSGRVYLLIVNTPKSGPVSFINYEDICFSSDMIREPQYYVVHQPMWNVMMVASANSMEVGVLGLKEDQAGWQQWIQEDAARAELPLSAQKLETFPIGLGFDTSTEHELPWGENQTIPAMPTLLMMSHHGVLCVFYAINLVPGAQHLCFPPAQQPDDGGLALFTSVVMPPALGLNTFETVNPTESKTAPLFGSNGTNSAFGLGSPAGQPGGEAPDNPPQFGSPLAAPPISNVPSVDVGQTTFIFTPALGSSTDQSKVPVANAPFSFMPTLGTGEPLKPAFSFSPVSTPAKPAVDLSKSGHAFGSTEPAKSVTGAVKPAFAFPTADNSLSFSFNATTSTPVATKPPTELPQQQQIKPQAMFGMSLPVQQSAILRTTSDQSFKPDPLKPVPVTQQKTAVVQTGAASKLTNENAPIINSTVFLQAIKGEMQHFERELAELRTRTTNLSVEVGSQEEKATLNEKLLHLEEFFQILEETTVGLNGEIHALKTVLMEAFAWMEEAKSCQEQASNPRYLQLMRFQELDPLSARYSGDIKHLVYYVESQLEQVNKSLDTHWLEFQDNYKQGNIHKLYVPSMETMYQSMVNHNRILNKQRIVVHDLAQRIAHKKKIQNERIPLISSLALARTSHMGDEELSTLADSLVNVKLDTFGGDAPGRHSLALAKNRLTSVKQTKLRELLGQHQLVHVCPAKLPHTDVSKSVNLPPYPVAEAKPGGISSGKPILNKSSSDKPILNKSSSDKPILNKSSSDKPILNKSSSDKPILNKSSSDKPILNKSSSDKPILNKSPSTAPKEKFFMFGSETAPNTKAGNLFTFTKATHSPEKLQSTGSGQTFTHMPPYSYFPPSSSTNGFGELANKQSKSASFGTKTQVVSVTVTQAVTDPSGFTFQPSKAPPYSTFSATTDSNTTLLGKGNFSNKSPLMSLGSIVACIGDDNTITKDLSAATASAKTTPIFNLVSDSKASCTTVEIAGRIKAVDGNSLSASLTTYTSQASSSLGSFSVTPPLTPKSGTSPEMLSPVQDKEYINPSVPVGKVDHQNVSSNTVTTSGSRVLPLSGVFNSVGTSAGTIFGSPSPMVTSSSIFGGGSTARNLTSIFGGTKTNILESSNSGVNPTTSIFGGLNTGTSTNNSIFGGASLTTTTTSSLFGSRTTTTITAATATVPTVTTGNIFGGATTSDSSFGGTKVTVTILGSSNLSGSMFGGTGTMNTTGTILGETNAATTTSGNMTASPIPSVTIFEGPSTTTPANILRGMSVATTTSTTIFGSSNTSVSIFGSLNSSSNIFGGSSTTVSMPVFEGTSTTVSNVFGSSNATGSIFEKTNADTTPSIVNTTATSGVLDSVTTGSSSVLATTLSSSTAVTPTAAPSTTSIFGGSSVPTALAHPTTSLLGLSKPVLELTLDKSSSEVQPTKPQLENVKPITSLPSELSITSEANSSEPVSTATLTLTQLTSSMLTSSLQPAASTAEVKLPSLFGSATIGDTKSATIFGGSSTTDAKPALIFGGSSTTDAKPTSIFGGSSTTDAKTAASIFGGSTTTEPKQGSIFGGSTPSDAKQPSIFGGSTPSDAKQPSIFGGSSPSDAKQPSIFGSSTSDLKQLSIFGSSTTSSTGIGFSFGNNTPTTSAFGAKSSALFSTPTTTASSNSFFGQPICSPSFGGSLFGQTGNDANAHGSSAFGSKPTFSQPATPFGQSSTFGAAGSTSIFGGGTSSAFGATAGGNTFQTSGSSFFGTGNSTGGSSGAFSSGQSISQSGFGSSTSFNAKPGGFGSSPVFERGASSGFGGVPTFGGSPGFGGASTFGASPNKLFGATPPLSTGFGSASPTQESSATFANLATQNTMTFGNLAQNQSPAFGSPNQSLFGASSQTPPGNKPAFSSAAGGGVGFGGSSFSSWR